MAQLTVDDLLPLEEYAARRKEFFDSHRRYIERFRRVRIGPALTLTFENRQTLWFRVQEIIRTARLRIVQDLQQELDLYNRLLPRPQRLQAALIIEPVDRSGTLDELSAWRDLAGEQLRLRLGPNEFPAILVTSRADDHYVGTSHWVQIPIPDAARRLLADPGLPAHFSFESASYRHRSEPLSSDLRLSLLDDLELADQTTERQPA